MVMEHYPDWGRVARPTHCRQHHSLGWGPGLYKWRNGAEWRRHSSCSASWYMDVTGPLASSLSHLDFSSWWTAPLTTSCNKPFLPWTALLKTFCHRNWRRIQDLVILASFFSLGRQEGWKIERISQWRSLSSRLQRASKKPWEGHGSEGSWTAGMSPKECVLKRQGSFTASNPALFYGFSSR